MTPDDLCEGELIPIGSCVRCYCPTCQYPVSAMSLAALADALNEHRSYARQPLCVLIPPSLP
jgi:hypothetical protein